METLSAPIIMHSNVLESKCLQLDAGMIHTYPLVTKRKDPTKQNHIKKHHQKSLKHLFIPIFLREEIDLFTIIHNPIKT